VFDDDAAVRDIYTLHCFYKTSCYCFLSSSGLPVMSLAVLIVCLLWSRLRLRS